MTIADQTDIDPDGSGADDVAPGDLDSHDVDSRDGDSDTSSRAAARRRDRTGVADRPRENRSPAAQRAIDRRRKRAAQRSTTTLVGAASRPSGGAMSRLLHSPGDLLRRMPFAVMVIAILAVGLGLTLWLSTTAAQDSYQLSAQRAQNQTLTDQRDALKKAYESGASAPELSDKATKLGMIPATNVPRLVVGTDGRTTIVGTIAPATGAAAPSMNDGPRAAVTPQPGSSTSGNTAALPASDTPGAVAPATDPIASNVLPSANSAGTPPANQSAPASGATPAASPTTNAGPTTNPGATTNTGATTNAGATAGSANSQTPR